MLDFVHVTNTQIIVITVEYDIAPLNVGLAILPIIDHRIDRHEARW